MPPPYANFHHSMPPPGSANAQAAAAAAMASAAMASPYGFPGMYQAPFGAQRPGGHATPTGGRSARAAIGAWALPKVRQSLVDEPELTPE